MKHEKIRTALSEQQTSGGVVPEITATFECESNGITGSTAAPVKRIERHDDGAIEVILDYWPTPSPQGVDVLAEALQAVLEFGNDTNTNRGAWAVGKANKALTAYRDIKAPI